MADDTKYEGWTNYETWCVALWIDNEEGSYHASRELAKDLYRQAETSRDGRFTREFNAACALAEALKEEHEEGNPLADKPSVYSDLLSAALRDVNWHEIATQYVEEIAEDVKAEDDAEDDAEDEEEGAE
jgi:hypothetical protein